MSVTVLYLGGGVLYFWTQCNTCIMRPTTDSVLLVVGGRTETRAGDTRRVDVNTYVYRTTPEVERNQRSCHKQFNPLMRTLKPHSNGSLHGSTVIGTLAVDGWAVTFGAARRGLGGLLTVLP